MQQLEEQLQQQNMLLKKNAELELKDEEVQKCFHSDQVNKNPSIERIFFFGRPILIYTKACYNNIFSENLCHSI